MHSPGEFEVIGIGICKDITDSIPISVSISKVEDLPEAMFTLLRDRLIKQAA